MVDDKKRRSSGKTGIKGSIRIGGDAINTVNVAGSDNVVFTSFKQVALPPAQSVDIVQTLVQLERQLANSALTADDHRQIEAAIQESKEEGTSDKPDKGKIGKKIENALTVAKSANNFVEICKLAGPYIVNAAAWLGQNWHHLLGLVGLRAR